MRTLIALLLATSVMWAQNSQAPTKTAPQQGPPPKNLTVRPDGHVSANQDPANPEQFEVHVVMPGETLSGIAGEVLKNPRLWPQLWEQNEHIINPHWIYPNDKILISPVTPLAEVKPPEPEPPAAPVAPVPAVAPAEPPRRVQLPPAAPLAAAAAPEASPIATASVLILDDLKPVSQIKYEDLYCSGSVRTVRLPADLKVIAKADQANSVLATENEYVYLSQGSEDGIAIGNKYQVIRPTKPLTNPNGRTSADRDLGMYYLDIAQLSVVLVQPDFALARVVHSCADAVDPGDIVMPFQPITIPEPPRHRPFSPTMTSNSGVKGSIVSSKDVMLSFGSTFKTSGRIPGVRSGRLGALDRGIASEGSIVYIDLGQEKAVKPGDIFIVYRNVQVDKRLYDFPIEVKKLELARTALGELVVVKVGERAATAVVTYADDALLFGDAIERR